MKINKKGRGSLRHNRPTIDLGTPEIRNKKRALLGKKHEQDLSLAESLLGILYSHELISQPLYEAGRFFGELGYRYEPCLGYKSRQTSSLCHKTLEDRGDSPLSWSDKSIEKRTQAWRMACRALQEAGQLPYKSVMSVVFYPHDLMSRPHSPPVRMDPLRKGLESLAAYFTKGSKGGQNKPHNPGSGPQRSTTARPASKGSPSRSPA